MTRGCHQGCPLSPLLFTLIVESFAKITESNGKIYGVKIRAIENKFSLYVNDTVVYLTEPEKSIPPLLENIK